MAEGERYALLRWFARDVAVGPRAVCYRCVTADDFTAAAIVSLDDGRVVATAGDGAGPEPTATTADLASRDEAVQLDTVAGRVRAVVPLVDTEGALALVLDTTWADPVNETDRSFVLELGRATSAALDRDGGRPDPSNVDSGDAVEVGAIDDPRGREKLRALQVTAETLVRAKSDTEIARVAVETARDVLDCPVTGIWLYDEETDTLQPAAVTDEGRELLGEPVSFERGESLSWKAFETGEIGHYDDVRTVEGAYNPETPIRSELNIPIGDHGVLTTATTRLAEFTDLDLDLLQILVSNTEAVLDRAAREHDIERYREMITVANDPILAVDEHGHLTHVNQRFVDLAPLEREALIGASLSSIFADDLVERAWRSIDDLRTSDDATTTIEATISGWGTYRISLSLLTDGGEFEGAVFVAHDVTELRRNEQLLSVFNRVLRHNLRNQLNLVLSRVDRLAESDDSAVATPAEDAAGAARSLLDLSDKTRRFQDVILPEDAGVRPVELAAEVEALVARLHTAYPDADIQTAIPADLRVRATGTLTFAVEELVENAIEHNDGPPEIEIDASVTGGETVELRVADNGPGIPEIERESLDRELEQPLQHASGLGLWMVRWTADTVGGSIEIRDNESRGTVVAMELPRAAAHPDGE